MRPIRIATRGSKLALWQAHHVRDRLLALDPGGVIELLVLSTAGDRTLDRPLAEVGGKGLFVKEIQEALLDRRADLAVHSMKDLPAASPPGLALAAVPPREDPRDALLVRAGCPARSVVELPPLARVGTASVRRACLLRALRRDLEILPLRGNVDTRLRKLLAGEYDAIVLAVAGLVRLGLAGAITARLDVEAWVPAIGQGALAIEARADDEPMLARLAGLHDPATAITTSAERAFLARLDGSCRTPLAAHATLHAGRLRLDGFVGAPDGVDSLRDQIEGAAADAVHLGTTLAEQLLTRGAQEFLEGARLAAANQPPPPGAQSAK